MTYYTVYRVTNKINGKFYIGTHKTKNLNDGYMGSGKYLLRSIEKHGLENFEKEILFVYDNAEEMYAKEAAIVNADFLAEENTYNLKIGGMGGWDYVNAPGFLDAEFRITRARKGRKAANQVDAHIKGNLRFQELLKDPEYKQKWISKTKGRPPTFAGKQHTEEAKAKIGKANRGRLIGEKNPNFGNMWITDGSKNKSISKDSIIPNGWYLGKTQHNTTKKNRISPTQKVQERKRLYTDENIIVAYKKIGNNISAIARELGVANPYTNSKIRRRIRLIIEKETK